MDGRRLLGPLGASLAAIVICIIAVITQVPPLLSAVGGGSSADADASSQMVALVARHDQESQLYSDRFNGRSAFFIPDAPPPEPVANRDQEPEEIIQVERPAAPTYGGPLKLNGVLATEAVFAPSSTSRERIRLKVGETRSGVRLVRIESANTVTVAWTKPATQRERWEEGEYLLVARSPGASGITTTPPNLDGPVRGIREAGSQTLEENDVDDDVDPDQNAYDPGD